METASSRRAFSSGLVYLYVYVVFCSLQDVFAGSMLQKFHPIALLTICFSITMVFFNAFQLRTPVVFDQYRERIRTDFKTVVLMNATTAVTWIMTFYALKYFEPALATGIMLGISPVVTFLFSLAGFQGDARTISRGDILSAIGIAVGMLWMTLSTAMGHSAVGALSSHDYWVGALCSVFGGAVCVVQVALSKKLCEKNWPADQILASRFFLLIVIGLFFTPSAEWATFHNFDAIVRVAALVFIGTIFPLYCVQVGIARCDTFTVSVAISIMPLATYVLQLSDTRLKATGSSLTGVLLCCAFMIFGIRKRFRELG